jgi:hypothetical protein
MSTSDVKVVFTVIIVIVLNERRKAFACHGCLSEIPVIKREDVPLRGGWHLISLANKSHKSQSIFVNVSARLAA